MIERESSSKLCYANRLVYSQKHFICNLIGRSVLALGFLLPNESYFFLFLVLYFFGNMDPVVSCTKEISEEDQKLRSFMNQSSIHSFNHTSKKDRIIRITNGRIFRNGKVDCFLFPSFLDRAGRPLGSERKDFGSSELLLQSNELF